MLGTQQPPFPSSRKDEECRSCLIGEASLFTLLPGLPLCSGRASGRMWSSRLRVPGARHLRLEERGRTSSLAPGGGTCPPAWPQSSPQVPCAACEEGHTAFEKAHGTLPAAVTTPIVYLRECSLEDGKHRGCPVDGRPLWLGLSSLRLCTLSLPGNMRNFSSSDLIAGPHSRASLPPSTPGRSVSSMDCGSLCPTQSLLLAQTRSHCVCAVGTTWVNE